jgi:hypothetical protein
VNENLTVSWRRHIKLVEIRKMFAFCTERKNGIINSSTLSLYVEEEIVIFFYFVLFFFYEVKICNQMLSSNNALCSSRSIKPPKAHLLPYKCGICDAPADYSYFGVVSCRSCKMFFKRNGTVEPVCLILYSIITLILFYLGKTYM